uniref:Uncharacterized protein n=1 Tax=Tetradesmus obliquus TaxID=3088 RepID=A0A383W8J4_TETOB
MSSIKRITGNACTFRGFRTWGDVAALWSSPGDGTVFRVEDLKTPAGIMAMLGNAVNRQAEWVQTLACDWQAQPYDAWISDVRAFRRAGVFYGFLFDTERKIVVQASSAPTPLDPIPAGLCGASAAICVEAIMVAVQGFPAITCDCSKLPTTIVGAAKPECRNRPLGQVHLNAALSNTAMTGLPWKLGSPMLFGCRA